MTTGLARLLAALVVLAPLVPAPPAAAAAPGAAAAPLVLLIAVDQLRRDRLDPALPGGLGRLAREGHVFTNALLDHAVTSTCPGHVTMVTGRHPGPSGIPDNRFIDPKTGARVYCVEDHAPDAAVIGESAAPESGRSPRNLRVDALGDWMKAAWPDARVFSVSGKDRASVALGGARPDAAYWFRRNGHPGFTTSLYYRSELPDWILAWNGKDAESGPLRELPEAWTHDTKPIAGRAIPRADDFDGESDERGRTSPHPLRDPDPTTWGKNVWVSPYLDELTLRFAGDLVEHEDLGSDGVTDLLAISLSGTDTIGHRYGPYSQESRDALERLDLALGAFLDRLDARFGHGRVVVALSSDHGVLPLPEWLAKTGGSECPVEGGRQGLIGLVARLYWELHKELSPFSWPRAWVDISGVGLTVNRALAEARGVPVERVVQVAERSLEAQSVVREAWTRAEIANGRGALARLYRNSLDPERSGDLIVQTEPTCWIDYEGSGTGHGTPYAYDREVPLLFHGPGIAPAEDPRPAATVDVAPTLAARIGVAVPVGLDGHDLLAPGGEPERSGMHRRGSGYPAGLTSGDR